MLVKQQVCGLLRGELGSLLCTHSLGLPPAEASLRRTNVLISAAAVKSNQPSCSPGFVNTCLGFMGALSFTRAEP